MNQKLIQKKQPPGNELQLQLLIKSQEIEERLEKTARALEDHYSTHSTEELTVLMVLKGSFILVGDLLRQIHLPIRLEVVQAASYGEGGIVKGEQEVAGVDSLDIEGKHILLIELRMKLSHFLFVDPIFLDNVTVTN